MQYIHLIVCPNCSHKQQTLCNTQTPKGVTICVFCGKSVNRKKYFVARVK